ncbi:hypothetical protein [Sphingomonas sp.]|uniref:hypothetical protein n=1 Tax=Sphingomonas sp. TaxID=28214 RepID=UPI0017F7FBFB|nr:hypothetical protein [Sphingomonas sp.]MBA4760400.1 hypothetical protein [Sphingomonas sp.]
MMLALAGCDRDATERRHYGHVATDNGIILVSAVERVRHRFRLPMDHGAAQLRLSAAFRARAFDGDALAMRDVPMAHRWDYDPANLAADDDEAFPRFVAVGTALYARGCLRIDPRLVTGCPVAERDPIWAGQTGNRAELIVHKGTRLVFGKGLDGRSTPCVVDLGQAAQTTPDVRKRLEHTGGPRFMIAYFPGRVAYIVDRARAGQPLYRLSCGSVRAIGTLDAMIARRTRNAAPWGQRKPLPYVQVQDIAPDGDPDEPALIVAWASSGSMLDAHVVLRAGRAPVALTKFSGEASDTYDPLAPPAFWAANPAKILISVRPTGGGSDGPDRLLRIAHLDTGKATTHALTAW